MFYASSRYVLNNKNILLRVLYENILRKLDMLLYIDKTPYAILIFLSTWKRKKLLKRNCTKPTILT